MVKFDRLRNWKTALDSCIRCGYCYEHCPIFKSTRWEIDAPRGKLVILHGLLHDKIGLTDQVAEKIFDCLGCGQCEKACSSGVPTLQIFADARADLVDAGLEPTGTFAITSDDKCVACLNCVRVCPHQARFFENRVVHTDIAACRSCGSCFDVCSAGAIRFERSYALGPEELSERIEQDLDEADVSDTLVVFSCNWSTYPGLQYARFGPDPGMDEGYTLYVTACTGRLTEQLMLKPLELGAAGVLIVHCPFDQCDHDGAKRACNRAAKVSEFLAQAGLDPRRVRTAEAARLDTKAFSRAIEEFREILSGLSAAEKPSNTRDMMPLPEER